MQIHSPELSRSLPTKSLSADIVVVGGGVAGTCFAITAAREGVSVILVQDRPVLGGNASSEVRLWMNGATSHGYNNNRWARESGVMNELLMHNVYRNPGGNANVLDTVFLEMVLKEPNLVLLLNTSVYQVDKDNSDRISAVRGFNSQNETFYELKAGRFCDASGDGIVGFLAGAAFRVGAESRQEFGEAFAPDTSFGQLLGHSIYFYSKNTGQPVAFVPPSYALKDIEKAIPRYRSLKLHEDGALLWWIEFGGRLDTIFETEDIKWELWRIVYGVWDYFKNSGKFPEAANLALEWVGTIPGKRESRRFEGDYMLNQQDVVRQRDHADAVAYGGWALDLHPADGVYSNRAPCTHFHSKGPYPVPYRIMYSRNIVNLFLAGRVLSCSHVAFGSLRNMASLGYCAQAAGMAAAVSVKENLLPSDLSTGKNLAKLQRALLRSGQHIPGRRHAAPDDAARSARITASSEYVIQALPADGEWITLKTGSAQMLPLAGGAIPSAAFVVRASGSTRLTTRLMTSAKVTNHTPENILSEEIHEIVPGEQEIVISCAGALAEPQYGYYVLLANDQVEIRCTTVRATGILSLFYSHTQKDGDYGYGTSLAGIEVDSFELWSPRRRPAGWNFALRLSTPIAPYAVAQITNGVYRPTSTVNAWVADPADQDPAVTLEWDAPQSVRKVVVDLDPDWDHPMESVIRWHEDRAMPFTVKNFQIEDGSGKILAAKTENYLARWEVTLPERIDTKRLLVRVTAMNGPCPPAIFGVSVYG
ncbi:MAG TPA: FAD-dependent oxidoreductase [Opitutaceae bacterium]|nr:FAD-dependent oxidoreductase [Opitutaceae bacterium]